jgi:hypothetical protein
LQIFFVSSSHFSFFRDRFGKIVSETRARENCKICNSLRSFSSATHEEECLGSAKKMSRLFLDVHCCQSRGREKYMELSYSLKLSIRSLKIIFITKIFKFN